MKKNLFLIIIAIFFLSSCEDYLDVKSRSYSTSEVIYTDETLAQRAVMGIYNIIGENNSYRNRLWLQMGQNTDIELRPGATLNVPSTSVKSDDLIALYNTNSDLADGYNNEDAANPWSRIYQGIERANLCIEGLRTYGNPVKGTVMGHLLGEALALRAFYYYDLIKWWGDVPFRTVPVNESNMYVGKTDRAVIYDTLINNLAEAEELLFPGGESDQTLTVKRFSKDAARGLRARIALSAAGYSMHPSGDGAQISYNFPDEAKRRALYTIARDECKVIIDEGKYKLDPSFKNIFYQQCQDVETHGREAIFELPYNIGVRGRMMNWFGLKHALDTKYVTYSSGMGGGINVMPSFYYDFKNGDTRRDITAQPYEVKREAGVIKQVITNITNLQLAKWRAEWSKVKISSTEDGVSPIFLRYADILLMYAEADLYLGATNGLEYMNQVRRRAFNQPIYAPSAIDYKALSLDSIKQERAFEFCGENIRKYDLIRWGELKVKMDQAKINMIALRDGTGSYADVPHTIYWKTYVIDPADGELGLTFYGLKRGETEDKTATEPAGGWTQVNWINETSSGILRLNDVWIDKIYHGDPDKRQLLPVMSVIINNSNGMLKNDYGYNN